MNLYDVFGEKINLSRLSLSNSFEELKGARRVHYSISHHQIGHGNFYAC